MAVDDYLIPGASLLSAAANVWSVNQTNKSNERMQQVQNEWNAHMWEKNNEYNSPVEQMRRLRAAGLNPDLMYGSPSSAVGSSSSPAQGSNPIPKQAPQIDPTMFAQLSLLKAQQRNIEADTNKKEAETKGLGFTNITLQEAAEKSKLFLDGLQKMKPEERVEVIYNIQKNISAGAKAALSSSEAADKSANEQYWRSVFETYCLRYKLSGDIFDVNYSTGDISTTGDNKKLTAEIDKALNLLNENLAQALRVGNKEFVDEQLKILKATAQATQNDADIKSLQKEFDEWLIRGGEFSFELFGHKFSISPKQMVLFSDIFKTLFK